MTPDDLDRARAHEGVRLAVEAGEVSPFGISLIAARLAREGWEPVDSLDILTDELVIHFYSEKSTLDLRGLVRQALERGMDLERTNQRVYGGRPWR